MNKETNQYTVQPDGLTCKKENPYLDTTIYPIAKDKAMQPGIKFYGVKTYQGQEYKTDPWYEISESQYKRADEPQFTRIAIQPKVVSPAKGEEPKEYILCAAIWFNDGKLYDHQPSNIETGFVVTGRRHHNCYATLTAIGQAIDFEERVLRAFERLDGKRDCQGFITNLNRYVDRKEGYLIADAANQIVNGAALTDKDNQILISENLY